MEVHGNPVVQRWFNHYADELVLTALVLTEVLAGIAMLAAGRRRFALNAAFDEIVQKRFGRNVLAFDEPAAVAYAVIVADARKAGRTIAPFDGQIAAIAKTHGHAVATRDIASFVAAGVRVINPWHPPA